MKGKNYSRNLVTFYKYCLFFVFAIGIISSWLIFSHFDFYKGLNVYNAVIVGLFLLFFGYLLWNINNKINIYHSDYIDYCDMENIIEFMSSEKQVLNKTNKMLCDEIWNNINRRAEKAKIVSLSSLQFREIKEFLGGTVQKTLEKSGHNDKKAT